MQARILHKYLDLEETVYKQDTRQDKQLLMLNGVCETFGCTYAWNFYMSERFRSWLICELPAEMMNNKGQCFLVLQRRVTRM